MNFGEITSNVVGVRDQWSQQFWSFKVCNCLVYFAHDNLMKPGGVSVLLLHKFVARFLRVRQVKVHQCPFRVKSSTQRWQLTDDVTS